MTPRVIRRELAQQDLTDIYVYIGQYSLDIAEQFLSAAEFTFEQLLQMPTMGSPQRFAGGDLQGVRKWRVRAFESYLIFYRPITEGIEILRVLHGARDVDSAVRNSGLS